MALNLSDPGAIVGAYESIVDNGNNWLFLKYSNYDELFLADHGSGSLRELKSKVDDLERVFIAFYREEWEAEPHFFIINYIPSSISGVKRARALVHSRRIGAIFKKHQATLTVEDLSQLTSEAIRQAFDQERPASPLSYTSSRTSESSDTCMGLAASQPIQSSSNIKSIIPFRPVPRNQSPPFSTKKPKRSSTAPMTTIQPVRRAYSENTPFSAAASTSKFTGSTPIEPVRRSFSENESQSSPPAPPHKSSSVLSTFMRRKKGHRPGIEAEMQDHCDNAEAPPIPPKDQGNQTVSQKPYPQQSTNVHGFTAPGVTSSEFAMISHAGHDHTDQEPPPPPKPIPQTLPLSGKWAPRELDFEERLKRRKETEKRRKEEEQEALKQERMRQEEARKRKEEQRREEIEEDERKRMDLEDELRRAAQERRLKEQMEKHEEERKRLELEERKRADKERRMEEHRRLEEWRREQAMMAEEVARKAGEARRKEEVERRRKIALAEAKVKSGRGVEELTTGWVTMQTNDSVTWKRRFYKFIGSTVYFYRSPKDSQDFLDKVELRGKIRGLREWQEGYEELEAIPYSFAIEFKDLGATWSMYTDSEEEKFKLLALLHQAAGL